jgi:hypothetical protein
MLLLLIANISRFFSYHPLVIIDFQKMSFDKIFNIIAQNLIIGIQLLLNAFNSINLIKLIQKLFIWKILNNER